VCLEMIDAALGRDGRCEHSLAGVHGGLGCFMRSCTLRHSAWVVVWYLGFLHEAFG
jgi:hypothetical protein